MTFSNRAAWVYTRTVHNVCVIIAACEIHVLLCLNCIKFSLFYVTFIVTLLFQFAYFNSEESIDYVDVFVGGPTERDSVLQARLSGQPDISQPFYSSNNWMILKIYTDKVNNAPGFLATWQAGKCPDRDIPSPYGIKFYLIKSNEIFLSIKRYFFKNMCPFHKIRT